MLNYFANIANIIEAVCVVITIIFIFREVRENTRLTRAANVNALVELSSPFNLQLIQDEQFARYFFTGMKEFEQMNELDQGRYRAMLIWWLILQENVLYQKNKGILDNDVYMVGKMI